MMNIRRLGMMLGATSLVLGTLTVGLSGTVSSAASSFKACAVLDTGGVNDGSFNESAWHGLQDAQTKYPSMSITYSTSTSSADYATEITNFENLGCSIIVTVGFAMDAATAAAAKADPSQHFAIVDDAPANTNHNIESLQYMTNQAAFLGGYLDAATSKTGVVATYGGMPYPTVTMYMSGFVAGVRYYDNSTHSRVKVLGFTPGKGDCTLSSCPGTGTFANSFTDQTAGRTDTLNFFNEGADIVFPVAGGVGLGSVAAAKASGAGHMVTWVDADGCTSVPASCKYFNATVTKGVEPSVAASVESAYAGAFKGTTYLATLGNKGVTLTYDTGTVSAALKATLNTLSMKIIAGTLSVNPNAYPATPK